MNKFLATFLILSTMSVALPGQAKIHLDFEADPLPLIKVNFVVAASRMPRSDSESLGLRFLEEFYEAGTQKLSRQKFQDALASYGASLEIQTGNAYAEISATFPLSGGKIPKGLTELIKDAWYTPRIDKPNFERTQKYLKANHLALLDRDNSLLGLGLQKVVATALFGLVPYSTDTFSRIKIEEVQDLHKSYYQNANVWAGVIGPEEQRKEIIAMVQTIFPSAGDVQEAMLKERLPTAYQPEHKGLIKPLFLLIDKKDLAQIHYGFMRVAKSKQVPKTELSDKFTYYVLGGAGLDSIYGKRIREDRGLAYAVSGITNDYYDYPVVSLYANPQRNKQGEAMEVLEKIIKETFQGGKVISGVNDSMWTGWLLSYRNSERQSGATPEGRIDRRKNIVTGDLSFQLYNTPIDDWSVKKSAAAGRLSELALQSNMVAGVLGDTAEIEPLVKKYFPNYEILKITYKDVINESWLKKK